MPALGDRALGLGHHTEVVFALPHAAGATSFELREVRVVEGA